MGMALTKNNVEAAIAISKILEEKKCTIADMPKILSYVEMKINKNAIVPAVDYSDELAEFDED